MPMADSSKGFGCMGTAGCCFGWVRMLWTASLSRSTLKQLGDATPQKWASANSSLAFALPVGRSEPVGKEYAFGANLGVGAFGVVQAANCLDTGEEVAVKVLRSRAAVRSRLEAEVALAASMRHPHIVKLYEFYRDTSGAYMVMERCSGGELQRCIAAAPEGVEGRLAARWVGQMLSAVGYLHSRSIVHRDIKPQNFLFESATPDAMLKLTDFGCSCYMEDGMPLSKICGTPMYMAPEVLRRSYDERVDVWSMGAITYELLCGRSPFWADSVEGVFEKVRKGTPSFAEKRWSQLHDGGADFTQLLLTFEYLERPFAKEALLHPWLRESSDIADCLPDAAVLSSRRRVFAARSLLERVAMAAAAWHLPSEQTRLLVCAYAQAAARAGGLSEFLSVANEGEEGLARRLEEGRVDYATWLAASVDPRLLGQPLCVKAATRALDPDRDGLISFEDVCRAARALAPALAPARASDSPVDEQGERDAASFDAETIATMLSSAVAAPPSAAADAAFDEEVGPPCLAMRSEPATCESHRKLAPRRRAPSQNCTDWLGSRGVGPRSCPGLSAASTSIASSCTPWAASAITIGSPRTSQFRARVYASA